MTWRHPTLGNLYKHFQPFFDSEVKRIEGRYAKITDSWKAEDAPQWQRENILSANRVGFKHYTTSEVFGWLAEGTSIRWAKMGRDFKPKTKNRRFGTYGQGGEPIVRGKSNMRRPQKKIGARNWHYQLAKDLTKSSRLQREMQKIFFDIAQEYGTFGRGSITGLSTKTGRQVIKQHVIFEV